VVDQEINKVLVALEEKGLYEDTLFIRISDHGDMAMAHGRQRQKMYNVYQQTMNVSMIFFFPSFVPRKSF
jgi:arylsulfatase A-like enzyme